MGRYFLSGQTTCALLLGAGLLLRAHAALQSPEGPAQAAARPAEIFPQQQVVRIRQAPRAAQGTAGRDSTVARSGKSRSHARNGVAHKARRSSEKRCGASLARRPMDCG
jgi:predicted RNase H-like nuclease